MSNCKMFSFSLFVMMTSITSASSFKVNVKRYLKISNQDFFTYQFNARRQQNKISAYKISSPSHWTWFAQPPFGGKQSQRWVKEEQAKVEQEHQEYCRKMRECFRDSGKTSKVNAQKIPIASCLPII